jgi:hypothetical protein
MLQEEHVSLSTPVTKQTQRDRIERNARMHLWAPLYADMEHRLKPFAKRTLLDAAESMHRTRGIPWPDRICYRSRQPLICHYCEHFPDFPLGFCVLLTEVEISKRDRNESARKEIGAQDPRAAEQDLFDPLLPDAAKNGELDNFTLWDDDTLDSWYRTD